VTRGNFASLNAFAVEWKHLGVWTLLRPRTAALQPLNGVATACRHQAWPRLLESRCAQCPPPRMLKVKDTLRATVHLSFDGRVFKAYHGPDAAKRFANEVRVLRHLEARGCQWVPRLLEADEPNLRIVTTNCGARVEHIDEERARRLFAELERFGVRHEDADPRNITYRFSDGRFCLIDFEFATILPESKSTTASAS